MSSMMGLGVKGEMKTHLFVLFLGAILCLCTSGCLSSSSVPTPTATTVQLPTLPATQTTVPPTLTPLPPTQTPPARTFAPPAARFLPRPEDFPADYGIETSAISENLALQVQLPLPKENLGVVSFRNLGSRQASLPQNGIYYRFVYWVIVAADDPGAQLFYAMSLSQDYAKQAFLVVMPAAVQEKMGDIVAIPPGKTSCDQASISAVVSDPYASYRSGKLPTMDPKTAGMKGGFTAEDVIKFPPDLYLYSSCRVKNVLIIFWGHAPDNYDGKNAPLPNDVIANQVIHFWNVAIQKLD
jgi:hypothetical protein